MSTHTVAMSDSRPVTANPTGFFRRLLGCACFVLGIAGFFAIIQRFQVNLSRDQMTIFAILAVGLAAGAASRSNFYEWSGWMRFFVTLVILPLGMFALGFFTNWQIGFGPLEPWLVGNMDKEQILHIGGGLIISLITLAAWRKPRLKVQQEAPIIAHRSLNNHRAPTPVQPVRQVRFLKGNHSKSVHGGQKTSWFPKFKGFPKLGWSKKPQSNTLMLPMSRKRARPDFQRLLKHKPKVNLALVELHRCPYCLEEVSLSDPRGVKKCEVCGAVHHADCWGVTGECQVPHLNT